MSAESTLIRLSNYSDCYNQKYHAYHLVSFRDFRLHVTVGVDQSRKLARI